MNLVSDGSRLLRAQKLARSAAIVLLIATLMLLRAADPVKASAWIPFPTSCGAVTGLPCIFCGMTRALHFLLNGDPARALYFNWLALPFLALVLTMIALLISELLLRRVLWHWKLEVTVGRLTIIIIAMVMLWSLQVYFAVSQHKTELLNPRGPLYALFVK